MANTFIGSGNLTRDAETRFTPAGKQLCYFTVAVNTRKDDEALFVRVTAWEKLADQCTQLKKGARVLVQGALKMGKWTGSDGKERQQLELTAVSVEFFDKRATASAQPLPAGVTADELESDPF